MNLKLSLVLFAFFCCMASCNIKTHDRANSNEGAGSKADTFEIGGFIQKFTLISGAVRTDGSNYYTPGNEQHTLSDSPVNRKNGIKLPAGCSVNLPDSFVSGFYIDLGSYYVGMIRRFGDTVGTNDNIWTSSLITFNKSGIIDMLPYVTFQNPGDSYKECWIQKPGKDSLPMVVTRRFTGEGEPGEGGLDAPEVFKIMNGKFKQVNVVVDTASFKMDGI